MRSGAASRTRFLQKANSGDQMAPKTLEMLEKFQLAPIPKKNVHSTQGDYS